MMEHSDAVTTRIITGAKLVLPHGLESMGTVLLEGNRIRAVTQEPPGALLLNRPDVEVISGEGCYLTPGLIELHFNGAFGCNLNHATIGEIQAMLGRLPEYGITAAMLTVITGPLTDMITATQVLEEVIHHRMHRLARPLGIHMEGPFINPAFRGTHPLKDVRPPNLEELQLLLSPSVRIMTIAPEMDPTGTLLAALVARGVTVSLGHSEATYDETLRAMRSGARSVTHFCNAMRPFHHREPGLIGAALSEDDLYLQLIGDGAHLHPAVLKMALHARRPGQILLTSDASPAAAMPEGSVVNFAGQQIVVQRQHALNQEGAMAGSSSLVTDCVRNLVRWNLASFAEAIQFATLTPANFLAEESLGRIEPGAMADLVLWNRDTLTVQTTFVNGQIVYQRGLNQQGAELGVGEPEDVTRRA